MCPGARQLPRRIAPGVVVADDTGIGITGHPNHRAATAAAVLAARQAGLPVLARALPGTVAGQLRAETDQDFAGQPPDMIDMCVGVSRNRQRHADNGGSGLRPTPVPVPSSVGPRPPVR